MPLWTFTWTTLVGYVPLTLLFVYLGSRLESLSPNDPAIWIGAVALVFFVLVTRRVLPMLNGRGPDGGGEPADPPPRAPSSFDKH